MKQKWLLDASALLAAIHNETGGDYVQQHIDRCIISTVNWSEVLQKLERSGVPLEKITTSLKALGLTVIEFTEEDAQHCASLWLSCCSLGLSLADRACLATGQRLQIKIITADRAWKNIETPLKIHMIR
jgi:PIN domain nuclease of toxin-antitoxin system